MAANHRDLIYRVVFTTQANRQRSVWIYYCWAQNATDAKQRARSAWDLRHTKKVPYMFYLEAHRANSQNPDDLHVEDWLHREISGPQAMHVFIKLDTMVPQYLRR